MSFSSSNYRIASSLSVRSAVDPEQQRTCLRQILQPIILDHLKNSVDKHIVDDIFSSLSLLEQHRLMIQQIEKRLNSDTDFLIERKGDAPLHHILFPNTARPTQTRRKSTPAFSQTPPARFSPMNRPPTPIVKPSITIKRVPTIIFPRRERTILNLNKNSDHPIERTLTTTSRLTRLSKKKAKTHSCTICHKTGHDEVHCDNYCCEYCNCIGAGHLPIECLVFLDAPVIPIPSMSIQPPKLTPPPSYFSNRFSYNRIVPGDIPHNSYDDGHFDDDYVENDTYCDDYCPEAEHNMDT